MLLRLCLQGSAALCSMIRVTPRKLSAGNDPE